MGLDPIRVQNDRKAFKTLRENANAEADKWQAKLDELEALVAAEEAVNEALTDLLVAEVAGDAIEAAEEVRTECTCEPPATCSDCPDPERRAQKGTQTHEGEAGRPIPVEEPEVVAPEVTVEEPAVTPEEAEVEAEVAAEEGAEEPEAQVEAPEAPEANDTTPEAEEDLQEVHIATLKKRAREAGIEIEAPVTKDKLIAALTPSES